MCTVNAEVARRVRRVVSSEHKSKLTLAFADTSTRVDAFVDKQNTVAHDRHPNALASNSAEISAR